MAFNVRDLDGDGIKGEWCDQNSKWTDCDLDEVHCKSNCRMKWAKGGEDASFGEYNSGTSAECCGDDPGEVYVTNGPGAPRCCSTGHSYVDAAGKCLEKDPKFSILFIPVDYSGSVDKALFDATRDKFLNTLFDSYPFGSCRDVVEVNTIYTDCTVGIPSEKAKCDSNNKINTLEKIKACADSSSKSHNYVIGIEAKDVCNSATGDIEGFASYASKTIMIEANGDPIVLAHEFGHAAASLNDEYFDAVRCKLCTMNPSGNYLNTQYMGSDPLYPNNDPAYCAGGTKCMATCDITCMGNNPEKADGTRIMTGAGTYARCIMGVSGLPKPRSFCPHCMEQIKKITGTQL